MKKINLKFSRFSRITNSDQPAVKSKPGFSLVEVIVSIFVFSFVMAMLAGSFASFFRNYINEKKTQVDVENAQYAMNIMAKALRTSEVEDTQSFPMNTFDYSQNKCIQYRFASGTGGVSKMQAGFTGDSSPKKLGDCNFGSGVTYRDMTTYDIKYAVVNSQATEVPALGKVTVSMGVRDQSNVTSTVPIQMSVSLRQ
jgi:prepilin-type N-terminal cleavage/methylation domain-containing protein